MIGEVMLLAGALVTLAAAVGVNRFGDAFTRAHAFGAGSIFGMLVAFAGAALAMDQLGDRTTLILAVVLQTLTAPVSTNLLNGATYISARRTRRSAESER